MQRIACIYSSSKLKGLAYIDRSAAGPYFSKANNVPESENCSLSLIEFSPGFNFEKTRSEKRARKTRNSIFSSFSGCLLLLFSRFPDVLGGSIYKHWGFPAEQAGEANKTKKPSSWLQRCNPDWPLGHYSLKCYKLLNGNKLSNRYLIVVVTVANGYSIGCWPRDQFSAMSQTFKSLKLNFESTARTSLIICRAELSLQLKREIFFKQGQKIFFTPGSFFRTPWKRERSEWVSQKRPSCKVDLCRGW